MLRRQAGMMLQEMLMGVALLGLIAAGSMPFLAQNADDQQAQATAADLRAFKAIADQHFVANRAAYQTAMLDGTGASALCKIGVSITDGTGGVVANDTTLHTCAIDGSTLAFFRMLPSTIKTTNAYQEKWVAVYRLVYDTGLPAKPTGAVEALYLSADTSGVGGLVSANGRAFQVSSTAADYMGGGGGVVPDANRVNCIASRASATYQACGAGWTADLSKFISATSLVAFGNRLSN